MTENFRELQTKLKALGYEVPILVMQTWTLKMLYRTSNWADYALRPEQVIAKGRRPDVPWFLKRFDKLIRTHKGRNGEEYAVTLPPPRYQGQQ